MKNIDLPKRGERLYLDGTLVYVELASEGHTGVDIVVRRPGGTLYDKSVSRETLAAARLLPVSATVFVRTAEADVFAVGTVEGYNSDGYLVSYPFEWIGRRAPAEHVQFDNVVQPGVIDPGPEKDPSRPLVMLAGSRLLCDLDNVRFRLVECREDCWVPDATAFLAQPLTAEASGAVLDYGPETLVQLDRAISRPNDVARLRQEQYMAPVDPLFDVYATPVFERWTWRGLARATFRQTTLEGDLVLKLRGHRISARISYQRDFTAFSRGAVQEMTGGTLEPLEPGVSEGAAVLTWGAEGVLFRPGGYRFSRSEGAQCSPGSFLVPQLDVTFSDDTPTVTREIFEGAAFGNYTDRILKRMPSSFPLRDAIRTTVFDQPAAIYSPPRDENVEGSGAVSRIAIVYVGDPVSGVEFDALAGLLGYLKGGRLRHLSTERFTAARRTSYQRINRSAGTKTLTPPVPLGPFDGDVLGNIMGQFPSMLDRLRDALNTNRNAISSILHHYAEARDTGYATTSIILISIAIDSLISFATGDSESNAPILDSSVYDVLAPRLQEALKLAFETDATLAQHSAAFELFKRKICENLNTKSNTKRNVRFWEDAGVALTNAEVKLLRKRHPAVHKGYVRKQLDSTVLWENYRDAARLANLFNRGFLAGVLGYVGPVLDATVEGREERRRIQISNGLQFTASGAE